MDDFNSAARTATQWTTRQLSPTDTEFLAGLPLTETRDPFTLVHGSLRRPIDEYLLDPDAAVATLALLPGWQQCMVFWTRIGPPWWGGQLVPSCRLHLSFPLSWPDA